LTNVQIQAVFDGQAWSADPSLGQLAQQTDAFLQSFVISPYIDVLKQYNVSYGTFAGADTVGQRFSSTIDDRQIRAILNSEISAGRLGQPTANSLYIFFTTPGTVVTAGGQNSINDFAGYHDLFSDSAGARVYYAVIPYPTGNITNVPLTPFQQETVILSHEISEGMTDPDTVTGWFDPRLGEIGDIADGLVGQLGGYEVQAIWSQADRQNIVPSVSLPVAQNNLFVTHLYQTLLGRTPDGLSLAAWTNLLDKGASRTSIVAQFEQTPEYRSREVQSLFQALLHRPADPVGLNVFTTLLANGGTLEQAQAIIAGSNEYFQTRGGGQASTFLQALYADGLNRSVDPAGLAIFGPLLAGGASRQAVAAAVFGSTEHLQDLVQNYYQTYLGRLADSTSLADFVTAMQQGMTDEAVVATILGSPEYAKRIASGY
jgi:hypothetical protein